MKIKPPDDAGVEYNLSLDYAVEVSSAGDGLPSCKKCAGRGVVPIQSESGPPAYVACRCVIPTQIVRGMERAWPGLPRAELVKDSPLDDYIGRDTWVTCGTRLFSSYLKRTAINQGAGWRFRVVTDSDLMAAWLGALTVNGVEILDRDMQEMTIKSLPALSLVALIDPWPFMVIVLGVKASKNESMPDVLIEALAHRTHLGKITWLVDQPYKKLEFGHRCYSDNVREFMQEWSPARLILDKKPPFAVPSNQVNRTPPKLQTPPAPSPPKKQPTRAPKQREQKKAGPEPMDNGLHFRIPPTK